MKKSSYSFTKRDVSLRKVKMDELDGIFITQRRDVSFSKEKNWMKKSSYSFTTKQKGVLYLIRKANYQLSNKCDEFLFLQSYISSVLKEGFLVSGLVQKHVMF
ncbi:hypothetical protein HanRHA438_Chr04g0169951 [Helianthus annuus]|uniref:Uncharacterized protein n=2 Tax=Helianthus annuus TaxID=4232 RepID=A0A9K3J6H7_HELAN|nr:hypothetical protein HanXRQr2_Chr04g0159761 [Helianthus annuus]KAJ0580631.1 hypothetical protein HanHA300_Chr04g0131481 [Helianthus annuus]KAJ0596585.1 hypothetical protein HanHA89_Chr04g0144491 [Helianthus annuus]KAJ0757247.1 hypothetical protein HanLR1_Chr04g0136441 [Helianthus annuus]KAJ0760968.1 hypothetical protein HanOQP8_Chr04g0144171 [Helianthus annuus]